MTVIKGGWGWGWGGEVYTRTLEYAIPLEYDCEFNHLEGQLVQELQSTPETTANSPPTNNDISSEVMSDAITARQPFPAPPMPVESEEVSVISSPTTQADVSVPGPQLEPHS